MIAVAHGAFRTVVASKVAVVYTKNKDGKACRIRSGVRVEMADGSWWFHSFRHKTWTKHWPVVERKTFWGEPLPPVERTDRYTSLRWVQGDGLRRALAEGFDEALLSE